MSTDFGQINNCSPPQGLFEFVKSMLSFGISDEQIRVMINDNPKQLLDI